MKAREEARCSDCGVRFVYPAEWFEREGAETS